MIYIVIEKVIREITKPFLIPVWENPQLFELQMYK